MYLLVYQTYSFRYGVTVNPQIYMDDTSDPPSLWVRKGGGTLVPIFGAKSGRFNQLFRLRNEVPIIGTSGQSGSDMALFLVKIWV